MKLIDLIKNLEGLMTIVVTEYTKNTRTGEYNEDELFRGDAWDCPWWVAEKYIDTTDEWEGISLVANNITGAIEKPYLAISVRDTEAPDEN